MPQFLADEMQDCIGSIYKISDNDRIFNITKSYLHHEMERGCKETGVKKSVFTTSGTLIFHLQCQYT